MSNDYYKKYVDKCTKKFENLKTTPKDECKRLIGVYKHLELEGCDNTHIIPLIFETVVAWIFRLAISNPKTFCGYDVSDDMGMIYEEIPKSLKAFNPEIGVPFHIYFQRHLWGNLSGKRKKDNRLAEIISEDIEYYSNNLAYL